MINLPAFFPPVSLASAMLFKPLLTAAMFALSASAMFGPSASPLYLPSIVSDKNDAFLTGIVSTLLLASTVPLYSLSSSCCSDGSKDTPLLSVDANILYLVLNCHLVLVRKHGNCLQNVCENHDDCPMGCFCGGDVR